jgi:dihydrofolate reductase
MEGGTTFHFIDASPADALATAREAGGGADVRIGGGASTVRQYLQARLIDELHLALGPVFMGSGENLWDGLDMKALGYECAEVIAGERATHLIVRRRAG